MLRRRLCPALLLLLAGCYSYATIDPMTTQPGASVRARINAQTADELEPLLGMETRLLSGIVIATAPDTMIIEVPTAASAPSGGAIVRLKQRVSVPRSGLLELESRTLNKGRTAAAAAGASAGVTALIIGGYILGPGKEKLPGEPGGPELRLPIFRLHW
jgi:hypothetical protein